MRAESDDYYSLRDLSRGGLALANPLAEPIPEGRTTGKRAPFGLCRLARRLRTHSFPLSPRAASPAANDITPPVWSVNSECHQFSGCARALHRTFKGSRIGEVHSR